MHEAALALCISQYSSLKKLQLQQISLNHFDVELHTIAAEDIDLVHVEVRHLTSSTRAVH